MNLVRLSVGLLKALTSLVVWVMATRATAQGMGRLDRLGLVITPIPTVRPGPQTRQGRAILAAWEIGCAADIPALDLMA
jgi:hypothetical protein